MTDRRFFIDQPIEKKVVITGEEFNHLHHVLRLQPKDAVILVCGDGYDYHGYIESIDKTSATIVVERKEKNQQDAQLQVSVYLGLVKNDSFSSIVTKLSELGVKNIIPFVSAYCNTKKSDIKIEKLQKVANMAVKQCDRSIPLKVENVISFDTMIDQLSRYDDVYFAYEKQGNNTVAIHPTGKNVAVVIGSIGGFSPEEVTKIRKTKAKIVSLGKRVLRVETACISLVSVIMYESGEWDLE